MGELGQLETRGKDDLPLGQSRRAELLDLAPRTIALARELAHLLAIRERQAHGEDQAQHAGDGQADDEDPPTVPRRFVHIWRDAVLEAGHGGSQPVSSQLRVMKPQAMRAPPVPAAPVSSSCCSRWVT